MSGRLHSIWIAAESGAAPMGVEEARLEAGAGIVGDRRFRPNNPAPEEELTLVAAEEVDAFNHRNGLQVDHPALRRNLVTLGVPLKDLVGVRFRIGEVEAEGLELCEPCAVLGRLLASGSLAPADVVRELRHRAGLRARILRSGAVRRGDPVHPVEARVL